jgi:predicted TIM-barrel fold metal-dependent hydrolase
LVIDNRAGNDRVLSADPRIQGLISANPWFGQRAIDELKRCRQAGAVGLFLHPSRQGFMPIEPIAAPLLNFAADALWPVMVHTGTFVHSDVLAVAEIARRYPQTPFILGGGGFADMWFEVPGAMQEVPNLWLETSHILGNGIRTVLKTSGPQRVLFGSGEPSNRYSAALKCLQYLKLEPDILRAILYENARRLFALEMRA